MDKLKNFKVWDLIDSFLFDEKEKQFVNALRNRDDGLRATSDGRIYRVKPIVKNFQTKQVA